MIIKTSNKSTPIKNPAKLFKCIHYNTIRLIYEPYTKEIRIFPCCVMSAKYDEKYSIGTLHYNDIINSNDLYNELNHMFMNYKNNIMIEPTCNLFSCFDNTTADSNVCSFNSYNNLGITKIQVSIVRSCNLNCIMCRDDKIIDDSETRDIYFAILNKIKNHKLQTLELTAVGEPFFYKKQTFDYLSNITKENDFNLVYIITNATLLNDSDLELLNKIDKEKCPIKIAVSFHSINKNSYETIMRCNLYEKTLHNILQLKEYGLLDRVNFVIQKENINDLLDTYKYFNDRNIILNATPKNFMNTDEYELIVNNPIYKEFYANKK